MFFLCTHIYNTWSLRRSVYNSASLFLSSINLEVDQRSRGIEDSCSGSQATIHVGTKKQCHQSVDTMRHWRGHDSVRTMQHITPAVRRRVGREGNNRTHPPAHLKLRGTYRMCEAQLIGHRKWDIFEFLWNPFFRHRFAQCAICLNTAMCTMALTRGQVSF